MSVGSVTNAGDVYSAYSTTTAPKVTEQPAAKAEAAKKDTEKKGAAAESGVVYEKTDAAAADRKATYSVNKMSAEDRATLVKQLKADEATRRQNLIDIVSKMIGKQAQTSNLASMFTPENLKKVDAATIAQAKEDVSEDGYYGVKQTSQRLFDFASALAGDDVDKMKKMQAAMEKGFKKAEKMWGDELPQISRDTIAAANQMFEDYYRSKEIA